MMSCAHYTVFFVLGLAGPGLACEKPSINQALSTPQSFELAQTASKPQRSNMSGGNTDPRTQLAGLWHISKIGGADVPDDAGITMNFEAHAATFFGGCNTISASAQFSPHNFRFGNISSTKKQCDAETMERETALLDAISKVDLFVMEPGDNLAFYDDLRQILFSALRRH